MDHDFIIGGIKFRVTAPFALKEGKRWKRFTAQFREPEHCYRVHYASCLDEPDEEPEFENERVKCFYRDGRILRVYLETNGSAYATVNESSASLWDITVREGLLPWGSEIEHLFVLYGLPHSLLLHDRLLLHCAYILTEYGAVVFTAPSGTGKTTQAELWKRYRGSNIINGDRAILSLKDGVPMAHSLTHAGSSDYCENVSAPLFAIVSLSQSKENHVTRLHGMDALRSLLKGTYLLPEFRADMPRLVELSQLFCQSVPLLHLACLPDETAVKALDAVLYSLRNGE